MIHHPIGLAGLAMSIVSAWILLPRPKADARYTADGTQILSWCSVRPASEEQRRQWIRKHHIQKWTYRGAVALLLVGFALNAADLLLSA